MNQRVLAQVNSSALGESQVHKTSSKSFATYKKVFHFSVLFYSVYLLLTFIPDVLHFDKSIMKYGYWTLKVILCAWVYSNNRLFFSRFSSLENLLLILFFIYAINIFLDVYIYPKP